MMMQIRPFNYRGNTINLAVTATSQNIALTQGGVGTSTVRVVNVGTNLIFFLLGKDNTVVVSATNGVPILPNSSETFLVPNDCLYIAVISSAVGNTAYFTTGESA